MGDFLAEDVDGWDEGFYVVDSGDEDLVFYRFGFVFYGAGVGFETVDYVVAVLVVSFAFDVLAGGLDYLHQSVADPVT